MLHLPGEKMNNYYKVIWDNVDVHSRGIEMPFGGTMLRAWQDPGLQKHC